MKRRVWVRFLAVLLTIILVSQPVWGIADTWGAVQQGAVKIAEGIFPDAHFRRYIERYLDQDQDGWLSWEERGQVTDLHLEELEIESLEGLEYFPYLVYLDCEKNRLTELDLRGNPVVRNVYCRDNQLSMIDARDCTELQEVSCDRDVVLWRPLSGNGENISGDAVSGDGISEENVPGEGILEDDIMEDGVSQDDITENDISGNDISDNDISGDDISGNGISENDIPEDDTLQEGVPENSISVDTAPVVSGDNVLDPSISESRASVSEDKPTVSGGGIYTVTFQSKGGSAVKAQTVAHGGKAEKPADPTRSKYLFAGWYNGSKKYDFSRAVTQDLTLTAKWTKVTVGKASIKKLSNTSRGTLQVTYAKVKGVRGYQIQVSTDKSFKKSTETYTTTKTSLTIRDRYRNKAYYVRVCAYKLDSEKAKVYGRYSAKKKLKIGNGIRKVAPSKTAGTLTSVSLTSKKTVQVKAKVSDYVKSVDSYYYLFHLKGTSDKIAKKTVPDAKIKKSTSVTMTTPLGYGTASSKFQSRFVVAVKTSKAGDYSVICTPQYIANPEKLASYRYAFPTTTTKKGLQVDPQYMKDAVNLGVKHTAYNICLDDLIASPSQKNEIQGISYRYNGTTYWFNRGVVESIDRTLDQFRKKNIVVSAILLMRWRDDLSYLIPKSARTAGHGFYVLNTSGAKARKHWEAVFTFLAQRYTPNKWIANWILGNEVNNYRDYHYTGYASLNKNAKLYADSYRLVYMAVRSVYAKARIYISLDQTWNYLSGYSHTSRQFLDKFAAYWAGYGKLGNFNIAFHPYPAPLEDPAFWTNSRQLIGNSINTPCISMGNLTILTNYVKMRWGSKTRIILSEQGFTSSRYGVQVEEIQAASIAYAYYLAEFNNMIDAFILHRHVDHQAEQAVGLSLGLWTHDGGNIPACRGRKKYAWKVFKYMDTSKGKARTKFALRRIGISSWGAAVPGYTTARFS